MTPSMNGTAGSELTATDAEKLRRPFPESAIGKLPRGGTHLDFVGHAAVTDRLLEVDPAWSWEPVAFTDSGLPYITLRDNTAELWIRLTVKGVTRYGVGTAPGNTFELSKQLISDALRNAAMRFGVALDLWSKEDLGEPGSPAGNSPVPGPVPPSSPPSPAADTPAGAEDGPPPLPSPVNRAKAAVLVRVDDHRGKAQQVWSEMLNDGLPEPVSDEDADAFIALIDQYIDVDGGEPVPPPRDDARTSLAALLASTPSGLWTRQQLEDRIGDLYDLMWQLELWDAQALAEDLGTFGAGSLADVANKAALVEFGAAAWAKAEPEMERLR